MTVSFLASHGGSSARHIINAIKKNQLNANIGIIITNNKDSLIYDWCKKNSIKIAYISGKTHEDETKKDKAILKALQSVSTDLVILSGYMKKIGKTTLCNYSNKMINIHPSLLPKHGGHGLYGDKVHESVLNSSDTKSGATIHFVTEYYDEGEIIMQQEVNIEKGESVESLKNKVQNIEGELYLKSIEKLLSC